MDPLLASTEAPPYPKVAAAPILEGVHRAAMCRLAHRTWAATALACPVTHLAADARTYSAATVGMPSTSSAQPQGLPAAVAVAAREAGRTNPEDRGSHHSGLAVRSDEAVYSDLEASRLRRQSRGAGRSSAWT